MISVSVCFMVSPRLMFCLAVKDYPREGGFSVSRHGWSVWRDRLHPPHATGSGEDQHLPGVCQACAEPELHEHVAALGGALLDEPVGGQRDRGRRGVAGDRKSTRLNSSHVAISYAVFGLKKKTDNYRS